MGFTTNFIAGSEVTISGGVTITNVTTIKSYFTVTSSSRFTKITPTAGKAIRIHSIVVSSNGAEQVDIYFGTGAAISTDASKAVAALSFDTNGDENFQITYPIGREPVGAADEVLSALRPGSVAVEVVVTYSEE